MSDFNVSVTEFLTDEYVVHIDPENDFETGLGVVRDVIKVDDGLPVYDVEFLNPVGTRNFYRSQQLRKATQDDLHKEAGVMAEERARRELAQAQSPAMSEQARAAVEKLERLSSYLFEHFPDDVRKGMTDGLGLLDITLKLLAAYKESTQA
jgi:hypothetical protein